MPSQHPPEVKFEIAHVLFIDIVGYSKLLISEQSEQIQKLKEIVRGTEQVRLAEAEGKLLRLPTGDGGALVFRTNPEAPVLCALEISKALKSDPELRVRMGIHSGPVNEVTDLNEQANIAGAGINIAQRVMDCADAGHILLSKRVAEDLTQYRQWQSLLHDLGEVEVKHGVRVHLFNLYNEELGNPEVLERLRPKEQEASEASAGREERFWIAVLPIRYSGSNSDLTALADGLTEEIVTGLSRFSYLKVISRSSTSRYANESVDIRSAGKELGARYVMEGSLRQAGTKLRIAVRLVDTMSGAHLWAENYERGFSPETIFELQDELVPRIVSTVADMNGVLPRSLSQAVRSRSPEQLTPYEAVLRSFRYLEQVTPGSLAVAREGLELAVQKAPTYADAWAMLAFLCAQEHGQGFNLRADCLTTGLFAARRAVDAAPANHLAHFSLAQALFFQKEFQSFRNAAERTVALNPMDGNSIALLGELLIYSGDWDRGLALVERAKQLNPNHPGWYWYADFYNCYRQRDYRGAIAFLLKADLRGHWGMHAGLAAAYAQLGENDAAGKALQDLLKLRPEFPVVARKEAEKWWNPEYVEHFIDGLCKAGLEIAGESGPRTGTSAPAKLSGHKQEEEGFWVAVLPFKYIGANADLSALADGLSEDIVTGLSRFSYLRVIARNSTLHLAKGSGDVRAIGKELGARYVIEGSLRQAGTKLRLAVQLVDAKTGAHLWAENYERGFSPETIFELQDDLVPRIVSTVADQYGALVHSMSESLRGRSAGQYSAHEAVLRAFGYWERMTPKEHAEVRDILEAAVAIAPDHSDCLAELACIYWHEYAFGYNLGPDPIGRARAVAQRAVASAPTSHFAHCAFAGALFFQKDFPAFRAAAERALALNRMDSATAAILGNMIAYAGDWEYGLGIVERAMQLNPHHAGWYHYVAFCDAYRRRDYRGALASALKVNMPAYHWPQVYLAAVYGQLGEQERARAALRELHALVPNFGAMAREEFGKWLDAELTEHLLEGLRKAGLSIPE
jgi:adenylate cyclase